MSEDFGEPWKFVDNDEMFDGGMPCVVTCDNAIIHNGRFGLTYEQMQRIVACVNFCQHMPTELLEALVKNRVGAATLVQWIRRCNTYRVDEDDCSAVCPECSHIVSSTSLHAEDCLLKKALDMVGKDV